MRLFLYWERQISYKETGAISYFLSSLVDHFNDFSEKQPGSLKNPVQSLKPQHFQIDEKKRERQRG